jgi:hypothetical protein
MKAFLAFSAYSNGAKLFSTKVTSEGELGAIHGVRLFSMSWVLLGHTFAFPLSFCGEFSLHGLSESISVLEIQF